MAKWVMKGYQADIDAEQMYTGQVYEERECTFLALRGRPPMSPRQESRELMALWAMPPS